MVLLHGLHLKIIPPSVSVDGKADQIVGSNGMILLKPSMEHGSYLCLIKDTKVDVIIRRPEAKFA